MLLVGNERLAGASLIVERCTVGRWPIQMHQLAFHKLTLVVRGQGAVDTATQRVRLLRDCLFLTQPFTPHAYPDLGRLDIIQVLFDARALLAQLPQLVEAGPGLRRILHERSTRPQAAEPLFFRIPDQRVGLIAGSMAALLDQHRIEPRGDERLQQARLLVLLADALRLHAQEERSIADYSPPVARAVDSMLHRYQEHVELADLARQAGWSPAHLVRRFKQETGMTPITWLNRIRIEQACHELLTTRHSISAIAGRVGFNEIPYFNRRFKALMGLTPSAYRFARDPSRVTG
ncbi:MAG: helix-turn-helix domain-containing protein [Planctomycetota bacterium]